MALFGLGKRKKEEGGVEIDISESPQGASDVPMQQVVQMMQQGYTDQQIVQALQQQGYKSYQIYDAINQAQGQGPAYGQGMQMPEAQGMVPMAGPGMPADEGMMQQPMQQFQQQPEATKEMIEEITEAIIDEKWSKIIKDINKVIEWKEKTDTEMAKIGQQIQDLKNNFDSLHKGVLGKISEYDENLTNVGVEIKAMEKVFQKILPAFTENVSKLDRLTKEMRPGRKIGK